MKTLICTLTTALVFLVQARADFRIAAVKGAVFARHSMQEDWVPVTAGDVLKPEDSMKLEQQASATLVIDGQRKLALPELVILDLSDLRSLTQEELLLKLAMEDIRGIPTEEHRDAPGEIHITRTTITHGDNKSAPMPARLPALQTAALQINGARLLFDHEYYATCVLKTKEIIRLHPDLPNLVDARLLIAGALEKMSLNGEALAEYLSIPRAGLSPKQQSIVETRVAQLKGKTKN